MKLKVALIQTDIIWEDVEANLSKFSGLINGMDNQVNLIVLPEMFNTGFSMNISLAEENSGPSIGWMREIALEKEVGIIASLMVKEANQVFNRLVYFSPKGECQMYDKRHLFRMAEEEKYFTAGQENITIEIEGVKIRPMVCYDLRFPVWSRNSYKEGVYEYDCLLYVANWPAVRNEVWKTLLKARAMENISYVIGVNRVGVDGTNKQYSGDSALIDSYGEVVVQSEANTEQIIYASLNLESLQQKRSKFPVGMDADSFHI